MSKRYLLLVSLVFFFLLLNPVSARTVNIGSYELTYNLIDYTPTCLRDCYLDFTISLNKDYTINDLSKFKTRFVKKINSLDLED